MHTEVETKWKCLSTYMLLIDRHFHRFVEIVLEGFRTLVATRMATFLNSPPQLRCR